MRQSLIDPPRVAVLIESVEAGNVLHGRPIPVPEHDLDLPQLAVRAGRRADCRARAPAGRRNNQSQEAHQEWCLAVLF